MIQHLPKAPWQLFAVRHLKAAMQTRLTENTFSQSSTFSPSTIVYCGLERTIFKPNGMLVNLSARIIVDPATWRLVSLNQLKTLFSNPYFQEKRQGLHFFEIAARNCTDNAHFTRKERKPPEIIWSFALSNL